MSESEHEHFLGSGMVEPLAEIAKSEVFNYLPPYYTIFSTEQPEQSFNFLRKAIAYLIFD